MKVLVAGATGAIGRPLVRKLTDEGHEVYALSRSNREVPGATTVVADAMDRTALLAAVDGLAADAVISQLTALKKVPTREGLMATTNALRTEGTANLLAAAEAMGASRFLTQSFILGYGYRDHGPELLTEDAPFGRPAGDRCDPHVAAMASTERQAFSAPEGIALRYGLLYGGDAAKVQAMLARRRLPVASFAVDSFMRVSNAKAAAELGWRPAYPTYHDGIHAMVSAARKEEPWPSPGRSGAGTRPA